MSAQHKELANGRWQQMPLVEQMANIGSEVGRTFNWKAKKNNELMNKAFYRALELFDLTLESPNNKYRLKEIARTREVFADMIIGQSQFNITENNLNKYFMQFSIIARKN